MVLEYLQNKLNAAEVDEAWTDTFLSALVAYPQLQADVNVEAWLTTLAHQAVRARHA